MDLNYEYMYFELYFDDKLKVNEAMFQSWFKHIFLCNQLDENENDKSFEKPRSAKELNYWRLKIFETYGKKTLSFPKKIPFKIESFFEILLCEHTLPSESNDGLELRNIAQRLFAISKTFLYDIRRQVLDEKIQKFCEQKKWSISFSSKNSMIYGVKFSDYKCFVIDQLRLIIVYKLIPSDQLSRDPHLNGISARNSVYKFEIKAQAISRKRKQSDSSK